VGFPTSGPVVAAPALGHGGGSGGVAGVGVSAGGGGHYLRPEFDGSGRDFGYHRAVTCSFSRNLANLAESVGATHSTTSGLGSAILR